MGIERVGVVNHRMFGEHVKAWARGALPIPASLQEFRGQLVLAGVGVKIPDRISRIIFVQDDEETLVVRLPCRSRLKEVEAELSAQGGSYPLPSFYEQTFACRARITQPIAFQSARIGDYSIAQCV